jgi:glycosyltransferase involved in cell wall biosynthesis
LTDIKHIAILCSRLDLPGGIERAIVNTSNLFAEKNLKVLLIVLDETINSFYPLHPSVQIIQHPLSFGITRDGNIITRKIRLLTDVLKLRKLLHKTSPDIIIATEYPYAAALVLTGAGKRSKIVSWEHHHFFELKRNVFWQKVFNLTYPRLDVVICLNNDEKLLFGKINRNTTVIPNFISKMQNPSALENKKILTVARLAHVKGIDLLISAAKIVFQRHPDWHWKVIGGDGNNLEIQQVIREAGLKDHLSIQKPAGHDINDEYQNASMYVMTSRHECLPMTLLEAQANGLPCIAFDCETGPRHIIIQHETGILVQKENTSELAEAISILIESGELRKKMGKSAYTKIHRFTPEHVYKLWSRIIYD